MDGRGSRRGFSRRRGISRIGAFVLTSELHTKWVAKEFASCLRPGDVVCLEGDLGAGKTSFVKGIASYFGIEEEVVTSPTFVYLNQYETLAHFDLYRLRREEEFLAMGFDEYFDPPYIACIEWPNILETVLPKDAYRIYLKHHPEGREIVIEKGSL